MISFNIFFQSNREEKICEDLQSKSGLAPVGTELIVWKKAYDYSRKKSYEVLVKLRIPAHAERIMGVDKIEGKFNLELNYWKKCRASEAEVLGIYSLGGRKIKTKVAESSFLSTFKYKVGKTITPEKAYNPSPRLICASGIHFFLTQKEAADYNL